MLSLTNNIRIVRIDKYNYSFEHYKEIEIKKDKKMEWVRVGGYYATLPSCLEAVKRYLIDFSIENNDFTIEELKNEIEALNGAYIKCKLEI